MHYILILLHPQPMWSAMAPGRISVGREMAPGRLIKSQRRKSVQFKF